MSIEQTVIVDYRKQFLGQRDRTEVYTGKATVKFTQETVQLVDGGLVVIEMDQTDWRAIAEML